MVMLSILIATFVFAVLGICAEYPFKKKKEDTWRRRIVFGCSVVTALLAGGAGYLQMYDQEQDKKADSERAVERATYENADRNATD